MTTETLDAAVVRCLANVYFDGKCVSHTLTLSDGSKKSVGVILPTVISFTTDAAETMEGVGGCCEVLLPGRSDWQEYRAGERFDVAARSTFTIRCREPYHYICHFAA